MAVHSWIIFLNNLEELLPRFDLDAFALGCVPIRILYIPSWRCLVCNRATSIIVTLYACLSFKWCSLCAYREDSTSVLSYPALNVFFSPRSKLTLWRITNTDRTHPMQTICATDSKHETFEHTLTQVQLNWIKKKIFGVWNYSTGKTLSLSG